MDFMRIKDFSNSQCKKPREKPAKNLTETLIRIKSNLEEVYARISATPGLTITAGPGRITISEKATDGEIRSVI